MTELLTAAQMRAIEEAAIESGEVTGLELMERAGRGVVEAIFEEWPELSKTSGWAVVLCGPGNNGGDGFVVARLLKEWGWEVEVFLYGDPQKLPPDARQNYERWAGIGGVEPLDGQLEPSALKANVIVDALFGTGLTRPISDLGLLMLDLHDSQGLGAAMEVAQRPDWCPVIVSVDLPSGLCSDSGRALRTPDFVGLPAKLEAMSCASDLTVTFHSKKLGHTLADGPELCGRVVVKGIGLKVFKKDGCVSEVHAGSGRRGGKESTSHKYSHGHALILSGGAGKTGAARLAARGALRIGAGLVTLAVPPAAQMEVAAQVTAIMLQRIEGADGLTQVLQDERLNALCLGPGVGLERAREMVPAALNAKRATVLDADALTAFADDPAALFTQLHENCVLTPHGGEFTRLFPDIAEKLSAPATKGPAYSKVDATREAAKRAGCVILFKGPDTVIAAPNGQCSVNAAVYDRAAPWLATAGSGDVLAGFITGLLARGFAPMQAAETAAWLHVECARAFGPGLIAEDLPELLPEVFKQLNI
ncbi:NAD(P)H-hydrate dehydratase [Ruegeria arenilitoris]|uniref:NAD(P)H-hydrate dehydratase n=1 Tax=Ruegeria arenilitoris TaxID=1173585 RepID=UPI001480BD64|nr:NAD(P)H-hydrate dehydratase [Ruegeria arenilitoris]